MSRDFIDTNIVVYANDTRDAAKQQRALALISDAIRNENGVISIQVIQEYANADMRRMCRAIAVPCRAERSPMPGYRPSHTGRNRAA